MITVTELAELTGPLLRVVTAGPLMAINDLVFADESASTGSGDIVFGAGVASISDALTLLSSSADHHAAAVVLREQWADDAAVAAAVPTDTTLLAVDQSLSWAHLVTLVQEILQRDSSGSPGLHADLFATADAVAQILDAPVTIEDSRSRVLAYSLHHERTDPARVSTIIGRRVPEPIVSHFRARGVFRRMSRSSEPIYVPEGADGTLPRLIIPIRSGGEWLGSIWAVVSSPASPKQIQELAGATRSLALSFLRLRTEANLEQRLSLEQVRAILTDPTVELPSGWATFPCRVVALTGAVPGEPDPDHEVSIWSSLLQRHGWLQPVVAPLGSSVFLVVTATDSPGAPPGSWPWLVNLLRSDSTPTYRRAAASPPVTTARDLPRARMQAEELLTVPAAAGTLSVYEAEWAPLAVHRALRPLTSGQRLESPITRVVDVDRARGSDLLTTLVAFLDHPRDPTAAAAALHVHPNTLRYRMRKITGLVQLDEVGPEQRLALHLLARATLAQQRSAPSKAER